MADRALARAARGDWASESLPDRAADLRAIVAVSGVVRAGLAGSIVVEPAPPSLTASISSPDGGDRLFAAIALTATMIRLAESAPAGWRAPAAVGTVDGEPAQRTEASSGDAAIPWPAVALAGIAVIGWVAAAAYVAEDAAQVVDRQLARREATRRMLVHHADVVRRLDAHEDAERAAGRQLPMSTATIAAIEQLQGAQAAARETPMPRSSAGSWFAPLALAGGLYLLATD